MNEILIHTSQAEDSYFLSPHAPSYLIYTVLYTCVFVHLRYLTLSASVIFSVTLKLIHEFRSGPPGLA